MTELITWQHSQVIELDRLQALDDFPAYVAIYSPVVCDNPFVLSPAAMQWSDNIVLNRVKECEAFWLVQKNKQRCDYGALFQPVLSHHFGEDFIAVFGLHPWQCLLFLNYQLQQQSLWYLFFTKPLKPKHLSKPGLASLVCQSNPIGEYIWKRFVPKVLTEASFDPGRRACNALSIVSVSMARSIYRM